MTTSPPPNTDSAAPLPRVVIVGGGTAGWMTAAGLARHLGHACTVELVESEDIGIVGVGEATLPHIRHFVEGLGLDEAEFMRETHATYKLGIEFHDFGAIGTSYLHPFGDFGRALNGVALHHYWRRALADGHGNASHLFKTSIANVMADANRFARPVTGGDQFLSSYNYAYQFDATRFAPYLRRYAEGLGVRRTEGRVVDVLRNGENGDVCALTLSDGRRVEGDLFVDCSGFAGLLIGKALSSPWEDWSHWLPCDRAVAMPCTSPAAPTEPYTRATAMRAGWRWRIPLTHRVGNGYVYSSSHLKDDDAADALMGALDGKPLADPRQLTFRAGRRTRSWDRNVVAIGLASGFLEPLESTSIYLAQGAIQQLIALFPIGRVRDADRAEFNRMVDIEYDRVRDFLILHYHATKRDDSDFWNDMRTMIVPDSLASKLAFFAATGRVERYTHGLFLEPSWIAVMIGQGIVPARWDQRIDDVPARAVAETLDSLQKHLAQLVEAMPSHDAVLAGHQVVPA